MKLELYHKWHCPYSARVRDYIEERDLENKIQYREIAESAEAERKLRELAGQTQVPCLVVDGRPMLESADIMRWIQENLAQLQDERGG